MTNFDLFAHNYDDHMDDILRVSGEKWDYFVTKKADYVKQQFTALKSPKILDYGCGTGRLASALKEAIPNATVDGFDLSPESIKRVEPSLTKQGTFTSDPGKIGRDYDGIVVSCVFHHILPQYHKEVLRELKQRLSKDGKIIIIEHNPLNPVTRYVVSKCAFDADAVLVTPWKLRSALPAAELKPVRHDFLLFFPKFLSWFRACEPFLAWCPMGGQYGLVITHR